MQMLWIKGHEDQERREKEVLSFTSAFDELKALLVSMYPEPYHPSYANAAWPYEQAHYNGERKAIKKVIDLITLEG
jgi:hypothetical protein